MEITNTVDWIVLVGRVLFVLLFALSAVGHLTQSSAMAGYAKMKGVPMPQLSVIITGLMQLVGVLGILLGVYMDLAALILVAFLIPTAFIMHNFWTIKDDAQAKQMDQIQFNKDIALAGAALILFALFAALGPHLGLTLTDPLFTDL